MSKIRMNISVDEDTAERLRQYAWEHHSSVSKAISDLIWSAKVKNEQIRGQLNFTNSDRKQRSQCRQQTSGKNEAGIHLRGSCYLFCHYIAKKIQTEWKTVNDSLNDIGKRVRSLCGLCPKTMLNVSDYQSNPVRFTLKSCPLTKRHLSAHEQTAVHFSCGSTL